MKRIALGVLVGALAVGCNKPPGRVSSNEPPGTPVELTPEDQRLARISYDDVQSWYAWHTKGTRLISPRHGPVDPARYEEALYCFHQAMAAWPKELPESAAEDRKKRHRPEPTDTLIQKGWLYLKMNRPKWALVYFKKFDSYIPYSKLALDGIAKAEEMLKQTS